MMGPTLRALHQVDVEALQKCIAQGSGHPGMIFGNAEGETLQRMELPQFAGGDFPGGFGTTRPLLSGILAEMATKARARIRLGTTVTWIDTDPAGTYLLGNQIFLSSQPAAASPAQRRLEAVVREANQVGFEIRVAIVPSQYDLGSVPTLWRNPQSYARFLETELTPSYRGRLLVVMPNGLGFSWPGMATTPNSGPLRDVTVGQRWSSPDPRRRRRRARRTGGARDRPPASAAEARDESGTAADSES